MAGDIILQAPSQGTGVVDHPATSSTVCKAATTHPPTPTQHTHTGSLCKASSGFLFYKMQGPGDLRPSRPSPPLCLQIQSLLFSAKFPVAQTWKAEKEAKRKPTALLPTDTL